MKARDLLMVRDGNDHEVERLTISELAGKTSAYTVEREAHSKCQEELRAEKKRGGSYSALVWADMQFLVSRRS
jgi:hypothetical protein